MFDANELRFLCEVFEKCRVQVSVHSPDDPISNVANEQFRTFLTLPQTDSVTIGEFIGELAPQTLYKTTNRFSLCYNYLSFNVEGETRILIVGPYLSAPLSSSDILEIAEKNGAPIGSIKYVNEFYAGIQVLPPDDHLFIFLGAFCEHLWGTNNYSVADLTETQEAALIPEAGEGEKRDDFDSVLINMKLMEKRYRFENEIMDAVAQGQIHKEAQLFSAFSEQHFEKRVADPLRNAKNYSIIMNTLLRKAAEKGGVHPMHLDNLSSSFAVRIESLASHTDHFELMLEMFRAYCRLVRKHTMQGLSPIVRKTVLMIESDLSANLTLATLAEAQNVSSGYLATIFKKETEKTVSEYIRKKRIKQAKHLLATTHLQVQTIALHCGIMDVQYFTKIFKKETGKTPKEYREYITQTQNI
ncbi:MAG: helix-turn-helix domain-containing protein [Clostridia bacterium]|nr:helix-turn-helix domain-containing protein [Clostridia bacterium]